MNPLEGLGTVSGSSGAPSPADDVDARRGRHCGVALILTLAIVAALIGAAFSPSSLLAGPRSCCSWASARPSRSALIVPLMRMNRRRAAQEGEQKHPGFDQRLLTFTEKARAITLPILFCRCWPPTRSTVARRCRSRNRSSRTRRIIRFASLAAASASVLIWLMFWGPGVFGYGTGAALGQLSERSSQTVLQHFRAARLENHPPQDGSV